MIIFVAACFLFVIGVMPSSVVLAANVSDNVVLQLRETHTEEQVVIKTNLITNTGISDMLLELEYDDAVFSFSGYERGNALDRLGLEVTPSSSAPIRFYWYKPNEDFENELSTGNILTLYFDLKPDCEAGQYNISFKCEPAGVDYRYNGKLYSKTAIVDKAIVNVDENKITKIDIKDSGAGKAPNVPLIVGASVFAAAAISAGVVIGVVRRKKAKERRKNWFKV
jgi:hypothetical protein